MAAPVGVEFLPEREDVVRTKIKEERGTGWEIRAGKAMDAAQWGIPG